MIEIKIEREKPFTCLAPFFRPIITRDGVEIFRSGFTFDSLRGAAEEAHTVLTTMEGNGSL